MSQNDERRALLMRAIGKLGKVSAELEGIKNCLVEIEAETAILRQQLSAKGKASKNAVN